MKHLQKTGLFRAVMFVASCCAFPAFSEIIFSGDQDGFIEEGEYLATGTITVKAGKTLTFAPGCVVRFKQYAGLVVEGALRCKGTPQKPIVFTSDCQRPFSTIKDKSPAPFDWNGITLVDSSASAVFENVRVAYGTSGLEVKSPAARVRLVQTVFIENGRGALTCGGNAIDVKDDEPFSFQQPRPADTVPAIAAKETATSQKTDTPAPKKMSGKAKLRWGLCAVGAAGLAFAGYSYFGQAVPENNKANDPNSLESTTARDGYQAQSNAAIKRATIGWGIFGAAACVFTVSLCF